ncbi:tRNA 2-selenouridine(34) synthase MnmH [Paludifilum halophilum]|uniref:tRNA 2-selenouridine(34) synthase MnmH n=1 Tax=Paludifilum halophilum TaxID=1642702 RepID=A0A235BA29_9BACL|nr:tRNA 2-selenouridine(34) synthase MnmH [Paludifilum halophilum]
MDIKTALDQNNIQWIDVRSPGEFLTATIPGAINVPLFNNEERARVGTVYKQKGREEAIQLGMELVSPKIPELVRQVRESSRDRTPLFFCWRGGMRSQAMATFQDLMQLPALRLTGGYRAYRQYITSHLEHGRLQSKLIVLHGLTGVGKTAVLHGLEKCGAPVLDLEGMAGHRGSAFGDLGEIQPHNQRTFDSLLFHKLERLKNEPYIFMEAESKRIGRVQMPPFLVRAKEEGIPVLLEASLSSRVQQILDTYLEGPEDPESFRGHVIGAISRIERKLSPDKRKQLYRLAEERDYGPLVQILLQSYYDPLYRHSQNRYQEKIRYRVISDDIKEAVAACHNLWLRLKKEKPAPSSV